MCVCVCARVRSRKTPLYIFVFAIYLLVSYMCAQIRVWSCLVTTNLGLFTGIAVCKFLCGWRSYGPKPFYCVHCMCLEIFLRLLYDALCPRSCAIEMSGIIIISSSIAAAVDCVVPGKSIQLLLCVFLVFFAFRLLLFFVVFCL